MTALIIIFIFGSLIGSFLNVCIYRMPLEESVVWPRSHCPHCKARIQAYDNIPYISYLLLKGRCRSCKRRIPLRYPIVELMTALVFVWFFRHFKLTYDFFFYVIFASALIIASFIDIKHRIIPDEVSVGGAAVGLILSTIKGVRLWPFSFYFHPMLESALGIIIGGGSIYLTGIIFDWVYFKLLKRPPIQGETESMGGGDVKFLAMIGAFLGWQKVLVTFFIAPFFASVIGVINLTVKKDHTIPYGPFLAIASLVSLFWSDKIIRFFFGQ